VTVDLSPQADVEDPYRHAAALDSFQGIRTVGVVLDLIGFARHHPPEGVADRVLIVDDQKGGISEASHGEK
jgi:hypothetical protein